MATSEDIYDARCVLRGVMQEMIEAGYRFPNEWLEAMDIAQMKLGGASLKVEEANGND